MMMKNPSGKRGRRPLLLLALLCCEAPAPCACLVAPHIISPSALTLGPEIARGNFGAVHRAQHHENGHGNGGRLCVVKRACTPDDGNHHRVAAAAVEYLEVEADVNELMAERLPDEYAGQQQIAPYLGRAAIGGEPHLVFAACGEHTLDTYLSRGAEGRRELARALDVDDNDDGGSELARRVLHDTLSALAFVHARGIVHRDVKPENLVVDADQHCLRLIDFGSACDAAGWLVRRGYRPDRVPCSVLYVPPEEALELRAPYTFDVYSAAMVYLGVAVPSLAESEEALFAFRMQLRGFGHDPEAWRAQAEAEEAEAEEAGAEEAGAGAAGAEGAGAEEGGAEAGSGEAQGRRATLPIGWEAAFGRRRPRQQGGGQEEEAAWDADTVRQERAWELLCGLIAYDPAARPTAAEALLGPYLNADCETHEVLLPAREPWTIEAALAQAQMLVHEAAGSAHDPARGRHDRLDRRVLEAEECALPPPPSRSRDHPL